MARWSFSGIVVVGVVVAVVAVGCGSSGGCFGEVEEIPRDPAGFLWRRTNWSDSLYVCRGRVGWIKRRKKAERRICDEEWRRRRKKRRRSRGKRRRRGGRRLRRRRQGDESHEK